jgi:hypothetical protein
MTTTSGIALPDQFTTRQIASLSLTYSPIRGLASSSTRGLASLVRAAHTLRIGEKFISWSDDTPPLDTILADVTLYWLTRTFPTSLYHYRNSRGPHASPETQPTGIRDKPVGYSQFPKEITPSPIEWVKATGGVNLVWAKRHEKVSAECGSARWCRAAKSEAVHGAFARLLACHVPLLPFGDASLLPSRLCSSVVQVLS